VADQADYNARARAASLIGTLQAGYTNFHYLRDVWKRVTEKEALIGVSMTGIASGAVLGLNMKEAANIVKEENARVAGLIDINPAARTTTVKPEGCLTLDTKIKTTTGNKTMAEIFAELTTLNVFEVPAGTWVIPETDMFICNENNEVERISKLYVNGISDVFEITTEDGTVVKLTGEHRLKTVDSGWKCAKDLREGDDIVCMGATETSMKITKINRIPEKFTADIEVDGTHTYQLENGMVSHNSASLVLGTSSGVHAWHSPFYTRRLRVGKNEAIYSYLKTNHPELLVDEFFKPTQQAVIEMPQKAPNGAITREESAMDLLKRVKRVWVEWVKPGHRKGANKNNVSTTVTIKPHEWEEVGEWMWENRDNFTALSVFPHDDHTYIQAPFEEITEDKYNEMVKVLHKIDLTKIVETHDDTELQTEAACAGGVCEII